MNSNKEGNSMKKILAITLALVLLVAALAGCAKPAVQSEAPPPQSIAVGEPNPNTPANPGPSAKIAAKGVDTQGTLNGRIDNNSVEIAINPEDTLAFRVTDVLEQLSGIKDGDMVKFSYEANSDGQLNITKIQKVK
jgi:Cu/Ag efflux protein CusF